jgi:hypothetical protein
MRTNTINILSEVTISTKKLVFFPRKATVSQPSIEVGATSDCTTVMRATVVNMIHGQNFRASLITTCTSIPIRKKSFLADFSAPETHIHVFVRLTTRSSSTSRHVKSMLEPITILAKQLQAILWKAMFTKPDIEVVPTPDSTTMPSTIVIHMVYSKESWISLAADSTFTTIVSDDLLTKFISVAFVIHKTTITNRTARLSRASKTASTHTDLRFLHINLATRFIMTGTNFLSLLWRFSKEGFTLFLKDFLTVRKVLVMAAGFADTTQSILCTTTLVKEITRQPLLTLPTVLHIRVILLPFETLITKTITHCCTALASNARMRMPCHMRVMCARFTVMSQTILASFVQMPVFRSRRKPLLTVRAALLLLKRCRIDVNNNIIDRLIAQCVEIEGTLNKVLGYNLGHVRGTLLSITPSGIASTAMASSCFIPIYYYFSGGDAPKSSKSTRESTTVIQDIHV